MKEWIDRMHYRPQRMLAQLIRPERFGEPPLRLLELPSDPDQPAPQMGGVDLEGLQAAFLNDPLGGHGEYSGFDIDFCRAIAVAIFGDAEAVDEEVLVLLARVRVDGLVRAAVHREVGLPVPVEAGGPDPHPAGHGPLSQPGRSRRDPAATEAVGDGWLAGIEKFQR